jgi:hypothetical protein
MRYIDIPSRLATGASRSLAVAVLTLALLTVGYVAAIWIVASTLLHEAAAIDHLGEVSMWLGGGAILLFFAVRLGSTLFAMGEDIARRLRNLRRLSARRS